MVQRIQPYHIDIKEDYQRLVDDLMVRVSKAERMLTHCDSLYEKKGHCPKVEPPLGGWYDYTPGDYSKRFESSYTGNWTKDSVNNSICNPEVAKRVLMQIWYKEEVGDELSEYESTIADSLNELYRDDLINPNPSTDSSNSKSTFPLE